MVINPLNFAITQRPWDPTVTPIVMNNVTVTSVGSAYNAGTDYFGVAYNNTQRPQAVTSMTL
jgi:hypothetical protein